VKNALSSSVKFQQKGKQTMEAEMKLQAKKEWKTPELIVLVRSKPEEAVLTACKIGATYATINSVLAACQKTGSCSNPCSDTSGS
jgi:hypothetical protein